MSSHVHITPRESGGWAVHFFDGRGAWEASVLCKTKDEAKKKAARARRRIKDGER